MANFQNIVVRLQPNWRPFIQSVRFRKRINIQRPVPPHYERAKFLAVCKPVFPELPVVPRPVPELCLKGIEDNEKESTVDNPFERILAREMLNWFNHSNMVVFFHANPMTADDKFKAMIAFKKQNMTLKVYGRKTAKLALEGTPYEAVLELFQSHNAILFSTEPQAAKLFKIIKKLPQFVLMAGIVEGRLLSRSELLHYSLLPDLQLARGGLVTVLNTAINRVIHNLNHHQVTLVSHLDQHAQAQHSEQNKGSVDMTNNAVAQETGTAIQRAESEAKDTIVTVEGTGTQEKT